jgi:hypothetical protein
VHAIHSASIVFQPRHKSVLFLNYVHHHVTAFRMSMKSVKVKVNGTASTRTASPSNSFSTSPQFQFQIDSHDDDMRSSEPHVSPDYSDRLSEYLSSNASEETCISSPYTASASEPRMYEHISASEPTFPTQNTVKQRQLPWDAAPPVRDPIPHIPGRRYYTYALTPEDRYHLIAGHAVDPGHHPVGRGNQKSERNILGEERDKVRRPRSMFTPIPSPLRPQHLRQGSTFDDFLQPHQFGKDDPAYSPNKEPKEGLRKRLRKKIGQGVATLKLKRRKTLQ